jgi:CcmD family protein
MNRIIQFLLWTSGVIIPTATLAQSPEMADTMRSNGKIYVVVGIILIVLLGLVFYLFSLDKKISRIEKEMKKDSGK